MREPVIVINGFCERYQRRLEEMSGFFAGKAFENLIFLCRSDFSEDALKKLPARKVTVKFMIRKRYFLFWKRSRETRN